MHMTRVAISNTEPSPITVVDTHSAYDARMVNMAVGIVLESVSQTSVSARHAPSCN